MPADVTVLVHSPLVGPMTWQAVAQVLRNRGAPVLVPSLTQALRDGPPFYDALAGPVVRSVAALDVREAVLVVHSGSGALVPSIVERAPAAVGAVIFVDALLPHPGVSWLEAAPAPLAEQLRQLASRGILPPWHEWFPGDVLSTFLPNARTRAAFVAEVPQLPLAYFDEKAPPGRRWEAVPCGYLRLSEQYDQQADQAERLGWPVLRHDGNHLGPIVAPDVVADLLETLRPQL